MPIFADIIAAVLMALFPAPTPVSPTPVATPAVDRILDAQLI